MTTEKTTPIRPLTREEMKVLRSKRIPNLVCDVLEGAYKEAGVAMPEPLQPEMRWKEHSDRTMVWSTSFFGRVAVEVQGCTLGQQKETEGGITNYARILLPSRRLDWLVFRIKCELANGTKVLLAKEGEIQGDYTEKGLPLFNVRVNWVNGVPSTRAEGDNLDLVLLDKEGTFVQLQIGVSSRSGYFWLTFQEVYAGQVVTTTGAKAEKMGRKSVKIGLHTGLALELYPENGFQGQDFLATKGMTHGIVGYALEKGRTKTLSKCRPAKWTPEDRPLPQELVEKGWKETWVIWFNAIIGWGHVLCEDGEKCFVHFSKILDSEGRPLTSKGEFPILEPQRTVAVRWETDEKGRRSAKSLRTF